MNEPNVNEAHATDETRDTIATFVLPTIGRSTIRRTVCSLIGQTESRWRLYVVVDGAEAIERFDNNGALKPLLTDERIVVMREAKRLGANGVVHSSAGATRNIAIDRIVADRVSTSFVAFVDDDDFLMPDYVEKIAQFVSQPLLDAVIFRAVFFTADGDVHCIAPNTQSLGKQNIVAGQVSIAMAIRTDVFVNKPHIRFRNSEVEDAALAQLLIAEKCSVRMIPYTGYVVRK